MLVLLAPMMAHKRISFRFCSLLFLWVISARSEGTPKEGVSAISWVSPWTYECVLDTIDGPACQRAPIDGANNTRVPLSSCLLTCGPYGALWPYPNGKVTLGQNLTTFSLAGIKSGKLSAPSEELQGRVQKSVEIMLGNVGKIIPIPNVKSPYKATPLAESKNVLEVNVNVKTNVSKVSFGVDESYTVRINSTKNESGITVVQAYIEGATFFGARHGLETLTQLMSFHEDLALLQIVSEVEIEDKPTFTYRGLSIDTARNFYPVQDLKKMIDGLSYNKLNMLHWHLTDSNSFPFYSKRLPQVTHYGIFDPNHVYTSADVLEVIEYGKQRGVKIIPELDAPSHAGNGWQWGPLEGLGDLAVCVNAQPYKTYCIQPPCGQLNPLNNNTYFVLGELFKDFLDVFDRDVLHMGGDEISERCWLSYQPIREWLEANSANNKTLMDLWGSYQERALAKLKEANNGEPITPIVWTSAMTDHARQFLDPKDYIIHVWSSSNDPIIQDILSENYRVIFSNNDTMYLDHGFGAWRGTQNKATLKSWQDIYGTDILSFAKQPNEPNGTAKVQKMLDAGQILGGEATLWSEKTDIYTMEMKLWPRGSALAERLWSNPEKSRTRFAYPRLINHRERMVGRGIRADTLLPESCYQTWGFCDDPEPVPALPLPTKV